MELKLKDPNKLDFSAEKSEISTNEENEFLLGDQLTGIELEKLRTRQQDREERKKYARHIFNFTWIWCGGVFLLLFLTGIGFLKFETSVVITLITTTTANILALFVIVANYLFYRQKK
jgi:cytosine/uracil/thiamine/allantoin permease